MISLRNTITEIKFDLAQNGKVSFGFFCVNYFLNPKFRVMLNYRLGKYFSKSRIRIIRILGSFYKKRLLVKRNCDISYNSEIGKGFKIAHPLGIVIGDGAIIEDNVIMYQNVTLGSHGKKGEKISYPTIKSGTVIYAGAIIIGGIIIGENSIIGANAVVNIDVPPNSIAVGVPCKIIPKKQ